MRFALYVIPFLAYTPHFNVLNNPTTKSDNYWLNTRTPCLTYGLRGITYYKLTISGPARDLHSGAFGRAVHEPMTDLIHVMSRLVTPHGQILVPGVEDLVAPLSDEEKYILPLSPSPPRCV